MIARSKMSPAATRSLLSGPGAHVSFTLYPVLLSNWGISLSIAGRNRVHDMRESSFWFCALNELPKTRIAATTDKGPLVMVAQLLSSSSCLDVLVAVTTLGWVALSSAFRRSVSVLSVLLNLGVKVGQNRVVDRLAGISIPSNVQSEGDLSGKVGGVVAGADPPADPRGVPHSVRRPAWALERSP